MLIGDINICEYKGQRDDLKLKTGMVEQLGRNVRNIWCYVTRKTHDVAQKQICKKKKENRVCVGGGGVCCLKS